MKMNSYIFVHLMGGLGNQMFQYAAGLLQKKVTNGKLYLEKAVENSHDTTDYRDELFTNGTNYDTTLPYHISLYQHDGFATWNPSDYTFPIVLLFGYFQNYKVLQPILPEFRNHMLENLSKKREFIRNKYDITSTSGFIHVRRGDYVKLGWGLDTVEYYYKAISMLSHITRWFIVSDDIEWCRANISINNSTFIEESDPLLVMALMSEIRGGAIIANSTFSWMGAYLGCGIETNTVIYPKNWIKIGTPDLFPQEWLGI